MLTFWIVAGVVLFLGLCSWLYWLGYRSPKAMEQQRHHQAYPLGYEDDPNGDSSFARVLLFPPLGLFYLVAGAGITAVRLVRGTLWQERPARSPSAGRGMFRRLYGNRL